MTISDEMMKGAVAKALLDTLTPDKRDQLLKESIAALLTAKPSEAHRYSSNPHPPQSMLQEIFFNEVRAHTMLLVREELKTNPELQRKVKELVSAAVLALLSNDHAIMSINDVLVRLLSNFAEHANR